MTMLESFFAFMREIAHISELTGLSVGALALLAAIVYFVPTLRTMAIHIAVVVLAAYFSGLYWYGVGNADNQAKWDAANKVAAAQAAAHDQAIGAEIEATFGSVPAALQAQLAGFNKQVSHDAVDKPCVLGVDSLRLRNIK
jgi:hypothetical protein